MRKLNSQCHRRTGGSGIGQESRLSLQYVSNVDIRIHNDQRLNDFTCRTGAIDGTVVRVQCTCWVHVAPGECERCNCGGRGAYNTTHESVKPLVIVASGACVHNLIIQSCRTIHADQFSREMSD